MTQLVLSLFPGIGLLDMAFEEAGFCVVRGPDPLWGGDVCDFHPPSGRFDGVIGGPPCQAFSRLRHFVEANGLKTAENRIPEFERVVREAWPLWFVMENVPEAPKPRVSNSYDTKSELVRDVWCGGDTARKRRFTFGSRSSARLFHIETLALHRTDPEPTVTASGGTPPGWKPTERHLATRKGKAATGYKTQAYLNIARRDQGLPEGFLEDASWFTVAGKIKMIGNGVPLPMGRAVAAAVKRALGLDEKDRAA